ncbi:MAG: 16S rRNA (cytidine(1402)-2'-O)-methyltransferase, partial [Candidatus Binatia bacterium]
ETPLTSYHEHNERTKARALIERIQRGENIALVSDAGTPTVSDPGYRLLREAVQANVNIVPIPGPSALTAVLSASGLPTDRVVFEGFLPAKKGARREKLQRLSSETGTLVFFEVPHRLEECLRDMLEVLGDREIVLAREVTKIHEEFIRGRISEICAGIGDREIRGELVLVVRESDAQPFATEEALKTEIDRLKKKGVRVKEIAELLGEKFSLPKREIYRLVLKAEAEENAIS